MRKSKSANHVTIEIQNICAINYNVTGYLYTRIGSKKKEEDSAEPL